MIGSKYGAFVHLFAYFAVFTPITLNYQEDKEGGGIVSKDRVQLGLVLCLFLLKRKHYDTHLNSS